MSPSNEDFNKPSEMVAVSPVDRPPAWVQDGPLEYPKPGWSVMDEPPQLKPIFGNGQRVGWSLLIATAATVLLGLTAIASGATMVGVVACGGMGVACLALVVAEILSRYSSPPR